MNNYGYKICYLKDGKYIRKFMAYHLWQAIYAYWYYKQFHGQYRWKILPITRDEVGIWREAPF